VGGGGGGGGGVNRHSVSSLIGTSSNPSLPFSMHRTCLVLDMLPASMQPTAMNAFKANSHITCRAHAVSLRVQIVSFPFDLYSAAVSDSHLPCRAHAVSLKATAQHGLRETACGLPARVRLLPATTRSSTKIVIISIPIFLTTIHTYDCKEWYQHTKKRTIC
jgi:hypothetical protein